MWAPPLGPLQPLACKLGAHRVNQRRVRRRQIGDRWAVAGPCIGCRIMLERTDRGWLPVDEIDGSLGPAG